MQKKIRKKKMSSRGGAASSGKIGIFDSGLGGLIVARAIRKALPEYDYVYLGDTKRVPYGNRSHEAIFEFAREGIDHLFRNEKCAILIIACNTVSARALRRLQREYLPENFPGRKILGVLIPAAEEAAKFNKVGIIGTIATVSSNAFPEEIRKVSKRTLVFQVPAPMLVPLAEGGETKNALPFIKKYLAPFKDKSRRPRGSGPRPHASGKIDALVLGCTHYPIFKNQIKKELSKNVKIISQDEIIPKKLEHYLARHEEVGNMLSRKGTAKILVTDKTPTIEALTKRWFGEGIKPKLISLS